MLCATGIVSFSSRFVAGAATCQPKVQAAQPQFGMLTFAECSKAVEMCSGTMLLCDACQAPTDITALVHLWKNGFFYLADLHICAAMRAMESEEDGRIYSDPLAGVLAGPTAMTQVRGMLEVNIHSDILGGH
jgi:hypothetical protein